QVLKNPASDIPLLRLAPAPLWGQTNFLTREQIIELARRDFPAIDVTNWTGPAQVRLTRRSHQLLDFQLTELLTAALQQQYSKERGELDVRLGRGWTPANVPDEPLTLKITELPSEGLLPNSMIGFDLWAGKERIGSWRALTEIKLWRNVPVARSPLSRGQLVSEADIALDRRDVLARREAYVNFPLADPTAELAENIPAGQPVLQHCIRQRPIVRRGQIVEAIYQEGSLRISLKVETLEEGALGQIVRVRNPRTHHDLFGKIQNEETILITL
ncbi:MAG TPA: flagellar basal body P-ring formation chaperone FlgA, partial [Verrucomicrobiae bacterium]|nr:flagellar basal body P-ring formation chaperone FlgA [Verrucomicrobiae bacterium]